MNHPIPARRRPAEGRRSLHVPLLQLILVAAAALALAAVAPTQARALDPDAAVAGAGSKWFSGTLLMQSGSNCSVLGAPYSETMVSAIAGYGGAPGGGVVKVGDAYWAKLLISIPGNPCGTGSTIIGTDLALPSGTSYDGSRPIRCFGKPRSSNDFVELTGGNWTLPWNGNTGPYCPATVSNSLTGYGGIGVGFRPLVNGQMFVLYVPVKSTQTLKGAAANPVDETKWILSSSGTYDNIGTTSVWTNVFTAGAPTGPYLYFARNPSVVPFWKPDAPTSPNDERNTAEWFVNLYSAGLAGYLCYDLYERTSVAGASATNCEALGANWNGNVTTASDLWQVYGSGPNGGFTPYYYGLNETYTLRWRFTPSSGPTVYSEPVTFTTLPGPDSDGDGVADVKDACPDVAGTEASGCQPGVVADADGDGVFGGIDKCPNETGIGSLDGCPTAGSPIGGAIGTVKSKIKRKTLVKGLKVPVTCQINAKAAATLTISAKVAKSIKLKVKRKAKTVTIGSASTTCAGVGGGTLKLRLSRSAKTKVLKSKKALAAKLTVTFTRDGSAKVTATKKLKLR